MHMYVYIPRIYLFIHLSFYCAAVRCISCAVRIYFTFVVKCMHVFENSPCTHSTRTHCGAHSGPQIEARPLSIWHGATMVTRLTTNYKSPFTTSTNNKQLRERAVCSISSFVQLYQSSTKVHSLNKHFVFRLFFPRRMEEKRALESRTGRTAVAVDFFPHAIWNWIRPYADRHSHAALPTRHRRATAPLQSEKKTAFVVFQIKRVN